MESYCWQPGRKASERRRGSEGGARLAGGSSALRFVCDGRGGGGCGLAGRLVEQVAPRVHFDADEGRKTAISGTVWQVDHTAI